jgi:hypothetical protein
MRRGDFEAAWALADRELSGPRAADAFTRPRHLQCIWDGRPIDGRRVLVRCYHGLGDTIQFARFLPEVAKRAATVVVWAQPALLPLLATIDAPLALLPLHDGVPDVDYDVDVEIMELPFIFRSTLETLPREVPYLSIDAPRQPRAHPRIGIVWRAGDWESDRSIPFDALRPLFEIEGLTWCSLQLGRREAETHPLLADISTADVTKAAREIHGLDLLITVDSMPAHLAGALAVPVWTLLKRDADWRWMDDRADSPWYPTMRLFRQQREGDWKDVVDSVEDALRAATWERPAGSARSG